MCIRQPALLSSDSNKLQQRLQHLQHMLGSTYQAAVQASSRTPQLLLLPTKTLDSKYLMLQQQTGLHATKLGMLLLQEPAVLTLSETALCSTLQDMQDLLQVQPGSAELATVLLRAPRVLLKGHRVLQEQVRELQEFLVVPQEAVAGLVRRCPDILPAGRSTWLANISTMLEVLGMQPLQVQAAVLAEPRLLRLKPSAFLQQAAKTAHVVRQDAGWQQQLRGLRGSQVLPLLRLKDAGLVRLLYSHSTGQSGQLGAAAAVAASKEHFLRKYPKFLAWQRQQQQQQRQLLPSAAAAMAALAAAAAAEAASMDNLAEQPMQQDFSAAGAASGLSSSSAAVSSAFGAVTQQDPRSVLASTPAGVVRAPGQQQHQQQWRQPAMQAGRLQPASRQQLTWSSSRQLQPQPRPKWQPPEQQDQQEQQQAGGQQSVGPLQQQVQQEDDQQQGQLASSSSSSVRLPELEVAQSRR